MYDTTDIVGDALDSMNGSRVGAFLHLVTGLMRGNPAEFKQGYDVTAGFSLASKVFGLTNEELRDIRRAVEYVEGERGIENGAARA